MRLKNGISEREYYTLLDWKDKNIDSYWIKFGRGHRLCDMPPDELKKLYNDLFNSPTNSTP